MPKSEVARSDYERAEAELYSNREEDVRRRLTKAAQRLFESKSYQPTTTFGENANPNELKDLSSTSTINEQETPVVTETPLRLGDVTDFDDLTDPNHSDSTDLEIVSLNERSRVATEEMRKLIMRNYLENGRKYYSLEKTVSQNQLLLELAIQETRRNHPKTISTRSVVTDRLRDRIDKARESERELETVSPESYALIKGLEFRNHIKELTEGKVVATPYVKEHLSRVKHNIAEGRPTFLHGHLGSGKTEIAITAAREAAIEKAALEKAQTECQAYINENPDSTKSERLEVLSRSYHNTKRSFDKALREGDKSAAKQFTPLIISGSKDLTSQDLFSDKTLKLTKFNSKPLLEHKKELDAEIAAWQHEHPEDARDSEKSRQEAGNILELYKLTNQQAFGTEVETVKQAVYRAVEEGRPVIIDEVNAIPSAVLISLNDILQRRPGESCYIPQTGPVKIKPGFSIIMTGNLNQGNVSYFGTEDLNPAFLSRLDVIEHDYLPMSDSDPSYKEQADPSKNELFQVVLAYLADRQGNLELPEMEKSLQKIFALSQLSHETGLIFGGKWRESEALQTSSGDEVEPRLEKSVLSIRNLLNVLKEWDKGSEKDLDKALWDGFISNMTNPDDQNLMLGLAKRYGFFQESDGWHIEIKARGSGFTSLNEAHPGPFTHKRKTPEVYSVHKVIEALYGPGPEREAYPDAIELDEIEELIDDEVDLEDLEMFEQKLAEINKSIKALEILGEQCGCTNTNQDESNG